MKKELMDVSAERAVLAGICNYGSEAYYDVADILQDITFTVDSNVIIYKCFKHVFEKHKNATIDLPTVFSAAQDLGFAGFFNKQEEIKHLKSIFDMQTSLVNLRRFAGKIRKLQVARLLQGQFEKGIEKLSGITGDEAITQIIGMAEDAIFDFTSLLNDHDDEPELLFKDFKEYLLNLADNPVEQIGISTGYPVYDSAIGGGLRQGVNLIGARTKVGKTWLADNIGTHIASNIKIPVLNLDTEMAKEEHKSRIAAFLSGTKVKDIETGKFGASEFSRQKMIKMADKVGGENIAPYYYKSIAGKPFEEQLAIMRRWLVKKVGLNPDGTAKPCVIIYDYVKLMDTNGLENLQEYQLLGFLMTSLHNFAARYKVPILAFIQLNRDGINKESTDAASGSDRIIWLCTNFSIYKFKSSDEIAEDGVNEGNRKLVPVVARHGEPFECNDYINMFMNPYGKIIEGRTRAEIGNGKKQEGFEIDHDSGDIEIPFN